MPKFSGSSEMLPWKRYWSPRQTRSGDSSEFLEDPESPFGKHAYPHTVQLAEITPATGLLVPCGEPGLGKTTELAHMRESFALVPDEAPSLIAFKAREFDSFADLQAGLEGSSAWQTWISDAGRLTILLDGLDEGMIRIPALVARLRTFLEDKPTQRLLLVLACRSFEWPEAEGRQLASLWSREDGSKFVFELEPLRREDARLAAAQAGHDGAKFLEAVHRADVAALASRPITLFFLLDEFSENEFRVSSRRQLYQNGCRRLCEESNAERADLLRRVPGLDCSTEEKLDAAKKLACVLLLGGANAIRSPNAARSPAPQGNVYRAANLINSGLLSQVAVLNALSTGLFLAAGHDCFGFAHQTFAECLAGQALSGMPLAQLRTLLCATDPGTGTEYVIPQLVELAAWVAGDHPGFLTHLIDIDPAALLRAGVAFAAPSQKAKLVERLLELAGQNKFFDEWGYWRF